MLQWRKFTLTKRGLVGIISISLALCVVAGSFAAYFWNKSQNLDRYIEHTNERAINELISSVSSLDSSLQKLRYATDMSLRTLSANVWREAAVAKMSLGILPLSQIEFDKTQKFIAQAGEYAYSILRTGDMNEQEAEAVANLAVTANGLSVELADLKKRIDTGDVSFDNFGDDGSLSALEGGLSENFTAVEQELPQYASLVYDGPFSDHLEKQTASLLESMSEVSADEALQIAQTFCSGETLSLSYENDDKIPYYCFTNETTSIEITKIGGVVLNMNRGRALGERTLSPEDAVSRALDHLNAAGFTNMRESYYTIYENVITINFAYEENSIIAYPDLIKVSVALDNGSIYGWEAKGYIMNHKSRILSEPKVSMDSAKKDVAKRFNITQSNMAIIPTSGAHEVFCYEFLGENADGEQFLVYVNAETGKEENMFMLVIDENGTLTV